MSRQASLRAPFPTGVRYDSCTFLFSCFQIFCFSTSFSDGLSFPLGEPPINAGSYPFLVAGSVRERSTIG